MLGDISGLEKIYIVCGYTDYPRRIIIREVFGEASYFLIFFCFFLNNDITDIFIVQTTIRRYCHYARTKSFIHGTEDRTYKKTEG